MAKVFMIRDAFDSKSFENGKWNGAEMWIFKISAASIHIYCPAGVYIIRRKME